MREEHCGDLRPAFGEDRRCLHDYFAGTQVRWVRIVEVYVGRVIGAVAGVALVGASVVAVLNREVVVTLFHRGTDLALVVPPVPVPATLLQKPASEPVLAVVPPPPAPEKPVPAEEKPASASAEKQLYQFIDERGVVHVTDDLSTVPPKFREKVTRL